MPLPISFLPHVTERLILRRFTDADLDRFYSYRQDPDVARYQSWSDLSYNEAKSFIDNMHNAAIGIPGEWFQIAIAHKLSNVLIGDIGMHVDIDDPKRMEIGFTLSAQEQGKGYAQEAVQALIDRFFELGTITKIVGITDMRNQPSINLLKRVGMTLVSSDEIEFKGEWLTEQTFELDKKEWLFRIAS